MCLLKLIITFNDQESNIKMFKLSWLIWASHDSGTSNSAFQVTLLFWKLDFVVV